MKYPAIFIFGAPGSGKGTISNFLNQSYNIVHISSGDVLRSMEDDSKAGKLFHKYADKGHLLPDKVVVDIWKFYTEELIEKKIYNPNKQLLLLDGIPRTSKQATIITKLLDLKAIIFLEIKNEQTIFNRIAKRAKKDNRSDDKNKSILETRLSIFYEQTSSILELYDKNLIFTIDAEQKPMKVLKDLLDNAYDILSQDDFKASDEI